MVAGVGFLGFAVAYCAKPAKANPSELSFFRFQYGSRRHCRRFARESKPVFGVTFRKPPSGGCPHFLLSRREGA
jgi:hypothetical protein